jgi:hypothetical protein
MGKYIADGLVLADVIEDDSTDHLEIPPPKLVVDKERAPMTIVEVNERSESKAYLPNSSGNLCLNDW